jgi:hypothetical protein
MPYSRKSQHSKVVSYPTIWHKSNTKSHLAEKPRNFIAPRLPFAWRRYRDRTVTRAKKRNRDAQFLNQFEETQDARVL